MDIQNAINMLRVKLLFFLWPVLILSCNREQCINDIIGDDVTSCIVLKETFSYNDFFQSDVIKLYDIQESSLWKSHMSNFIEYDSSYICTYCNENNHIYQYIKTGRGFCKEVELSTCRFAAVYIDTLNCQLIYHEISYTID